MKIKTFAVATFVVSLPIAAYAQGTVRGAEDGATAGDR
jgi:ABC-type arginine transport system permease subunit